MKTVSVVVPVYKTELQGNELISFRQTVKVLSSYDIVLASPENMDTAQYESCAKEYGCVILKKEFPPQFFSGIEGYNRMLLSQFFYSAFKEYRYILICQLDAFVFKDELLDWCAKGYDYIGAPLVGEFSDTHFSNDMRVGNGGFSLRRVEAFLDYFTARRNVFNGKQISRRISLWRKPYTRLFVWGLMVLGWRNKPKSVADHWAYNEDDFWSGVLDNSRYSLNKSSIEDAISFAFERFPSNLYEKNSRRLPFGCHAWWKYEYMGFWADLISDTK